MERVKRLVPYSLYLPVEIYEQLKSVAQARQASSMVRDAITMILEGNDQYTAGYKQAARDIIKILEEERVANLIAYDGTNIANMIIGAIEELPRLK